MDYIHTLLIMEDDLDAEGANMAGEEDTTETALASTTTTAVVEPSVGEVDPGPSGSAPLVEWCVCGRCSLCHKQSKISVASKELA